MPDDAVLSFNPKVENAYTPGEPGTKEEMQAIVDTPMPLRYTWCVWEQEQMDETKTKYRDSTRKVAKFSTVQEFWKLWHNVPQPSELLDGKVMVREIEGEEGKTETSVIGALMIFREGIKPEWEDKHNARGGHCQYAMKPGVPDAEGKLKPGCYPPGQIDEFWNNVVLGVIGSTIEPCNVITGVRLVDKLHGNVRHGAMLRLEVWYLDKEDATRLTQLRRNIDTALRTRPDGSQGPNTLKCDQREHCRERDHNRHR
mmetsp:Transcript_35273/g.74743  ORF Transcript_35273/g.74743 Transcript_35273/m.74743 type:complete len:256 (+) Transcript_35273:58-825(+)